MSEDIRKSQIQEATRDIVMTELLVRLTAIERLLLSKKIIEEKNLIEFINGCLEDLADNVAKSGEGNEILINFLKNRKK